MNDEIALIRQLDHLRAQHRDLDIKIAQLSAYDQFQLNRLKKEKLQLRDEILRIEELLYPDIIA